MVLFFTSRLMIKLVRKVDNTIAISISRNSRALRPGCLLWIRHCAPAVDDKNQRCNSKCHQPKNSCNSFISKHLSIDYWSTLSTVFICERTPSTYYSVFQFSNFGVWLVHWLDPLPCISTVAGLSPVNITQDPCTYYSIYYSADGLNSYIC